MIPISFPKVSTTKWQAIVFDLDDTLYSERDYVLSGFQAIAAWAETSSRIPASEAFQELKSLFDRGVRGDTFDRWLRQRKLPPDLVSTLVSTYRQHSPAIKPDPDAREVLEALQKQYRLALVSDGYLEVQKAKLTALGLERFFEAIVFSDELGRDHWKPSQLPFTTAAKLLRLQPAEMLYVADNPVKDFLGARQLGMFTVRLQRDGGEYAALEPAGAEYAPDLTISSLRELQTFLVSAAKT
jgi:putative hydrolase of the HAD superfamily